MSCTPSDRLRWIAEFLELAGKAVSLIACVEGIDYSEELHRDAQRDLRDLADRFDANEESASHLGAIRVPGDPLLSALGKLRSSSGIVGRLCDVPSPPMELLEVSHVVQCALVRMHEYATERTLPGSDRAPDSLGIERHVDGHSPQDELSTKGAEDAIECLGYNRTGVNTVGVGGLESSTRSGSFRV